MVFRHLRPVWAEIDLDNMAFNMREIRRVSKSREIIAIIKADAYGHGAVDVAETLLRNGATGFAVAVVSEAIELRRSGIECPIMLLGFTPPSMAEEIIKYNVDQTVYSYELAEELSKAAVNSHKKVKVYIALDTGMGRIGYSADEESVKEVLRIAELPNLEIKGLFSHFSTSDEKDKDYTYFQLNKFNWFYNKLKESGVNINIRHIANSAAIIDMPETHFEAVRPGIILYGYYPSEEVLKSNIRLKPVMSLKTNVVHIKTLPVGEYISYGRKFCTSRKTVVATLPVGYADGYTRLLTGKAKVIINGKFAPVIGRICMDQCMVDVTDIQGVEVGDDVILMGASEDGSIQMTADNIADMLGTINYEVLCMISKRVPRVYIEGGKVINIRNYV